MNIVYTTIGVHICGLPTVQQSGNKFEFCLQLISGKLHYFIEKAAVLKVR